MTSRKELILSEILENIDEHKEYITVKKEEGDVKFVRFLIEEDTPILKAAIMENFNARNMTYNELKERYVELGFEEMPIYNDITILKSKSEMKDKKFLRYLDLLNLRLLLVSDNEDEDKIHLAANQLKRMLVSNKDRIDEVLEIISSLKEE